MVEGSFTLVDPRHREPHAARAGTPFPIIPPINALLFRNASALMPNREGSYPRRISCLDVETLAVTKDHCGTVKLPWCFDSGAADTNH